MIAVPQSTVEKPLTSIDYIACLEHCLTLEEVGTFSERLPEWVRADERFTKAVAKRLAAIKEKGRP